MSTAITVVSKFDVPTLSSKNVVSCGYDCLTRYIAPSRRSQGIGRFFSAACMGQAKRLPESRKADTACELLCTSCGKMKPPDDFYPHAKIARGRQYWCKECFAEKRRERAALPQDPKVTRKYKLKEAYGLTQGDYDAMYQRQNGRCAVCGAAKEPWEPGWGVKGRARFLVVDHDHVTGRVRGLLCVHCNCGIGQFRENPAIMRAAMAYLASPPGQLAA